MSLPQETITAYKGKVTICLDIIHSYYTEIDEIWIPAPYNLTVNMASGLTSGPSVNLFSTDKPRFTQRAEIPISRTLADQYLRYIYDKTEVEAATKSIFGITSEPDSDED